MEPYFIFDLRNNRFAAGVLDSSDGKLRWISEKIQVRQREDVYDSVDETDLCFFRPPREKSWNPISLTALPKLPDNYEKIVNLFDEPDASLQIKIKPALGSLLKPFINRQQRLEMLFLVDTIRIAENLTELIHKLDRPCRIIVQPSDMDNIAGFALLEVEQQSLPKENKVITCTIGGTSHSYRWNSSYFEEVSSKGLRSVSTWNNIGDLERAGLVAFDLFWSDYLVVEKKKQLKQLGDENKQLHDLFAKMDQIYSKLQGFSGDHHAQPA